MKINLYDNIRKYRKNIGLTQEQLAEAMGVSVGAVHKWEAGLSTPEITLIVKLAAFFDTSVDVLLGYEMKDNRQEAVQGRLWECFNNHDLSGLEEAEQALVKYPNSYNIAYVSATLYMVFGEQAENKKWLHRALELFGECKRLISQNNDPTINLMTLQGNEAMIYYKLGEPKRTAKLLEECNAGGYYDDLIGLAYTLPLNDAEKGKQYLFRSFISNIYHMINLIPGFVKIYVCKKDYRTAENYMDWMDSVLDGLKKENVIDPLDKIRSSFMVCRAYIQVHTSKKREAKKTLSEAKKAAEQFDKNPNYDLGDMRFTDTSVHYTSYDILGETAADGIEATVRLLNDPELNKLRDEILKENAPIKGRK